MISFKGIALKDAHVHVLKHASKEELFEAIQHSEKALRLVGRDTFTGRVHLHNIAEYEDALVSRFSET
jgi:hypothetical protein